ncbi:hypothetical protein F1559_002061 [Cyanidiococcus yangmingshanensis]|uniref:Uncharacterized protein n=1 Tax=Cyanidiococcus yangmingshanensis TaxID=2690220 RepID=A0A7J7ICQ4_9RHOD|nr:hypothetical protein F1559_002061 [Cyanidiococcus yangmingshanensis]
MTSLRGQCPSGESHFQTFQNPKYASIAVLRNDQVRNRPSGRIWTPQYLQGHYPRSAQRYVAVLPVLEPLQRWRLDPLLSLAFLGLVCLNLLIWFWRRIALIRRIEDTDDLRLDTKLHSVSLGVGERQTGVWKTPGVDELRRSIARPEQLDSRVTAQSQATSDPLTSNCIPNVGFGETVRQLSKRLRDLEKLVAEKEAQQAALERERRELEQVHLATKAQLQACQQQLTQLKQVHKQQVKEWNEKWAVYHAETADQVQRLKTQARERFAVSTITATNDDGTGQTMASTGSGALCSAGDVALGSRNRFSTGAEASRRRLGALATIQCSVAYLERIARRM